MWKSQRVTTLLRRASKYGSRNGRALVPLGAAISLILLAELKHRQLTEESSSSTSEAPSLQQQWQQNSDELQKLLQFSSLTTTNLSLANCEGTNCEGKLRTMTKRQSLKRYQTLRKLVDDSTKTILKKRYQVNWAEPLGEGSFGTVYYCVDRATGEAYALKKISQKYTDADEFFREMNALLHVRKAGGHPGLCYLREHFIEGGHYYLVLDLIRGGEMFDHLVEQGAFSEADAARLVQEVAASLAFIHGLGMTHGDLKPENLMMTSTDASNSAIKLVDFGCANIREQEVQGEELEGGSMDGKTLAYCPPEVLIKSANGKPYRMHPSMDMWALGVILYIMLTGMHPYDIRGTATDEDIAREVASGKRPPLKNSPITAHLSPSAIDLIDKLMTRDPKKRLDAYQMLDHPWVKGETAKRDKIQDSDKKLSMYTRYKSGIERKVFENLVNWSDDSSDQLQNKTSLIEQSYRWFDQGQKGHISKEDFRRLGMSEEDTSDDQDSGTLSLSGFSSLLADHMKNKYFPKGHIVYRENDVGNHMYFISSGTVTVTTNLGSQSKRGPGEYFGEGALFHPQKARSATIQCVTPVHAMEISREYFEEYLKKSDEALYFALREKDNIRKRNRARNILRLQKDLKTRFVQKSEILFKDGERDDDSLFLVETGRVDILMGGKHVLTATPGNLCGEHSTLMNRPRNCTAICASQGGCKVLEMPGKDFQRLMEQAPAIKSSLRDLCFRRDFKKAVVHRLNKEFPYSNPREAFDAVKTDRSNLNDLSVKEVTSLMREFDPSYTDGEIHELISTIDLNGTDSISFGEFQKVFIADIKKSASI